MLREIINRKRVLPPYYSEIIATEIAPISIRCPVPSAKLLCFSCFSHFTFYYTWRKPLSSWGLIEMHPQKVL